jgi:hypothetical protein
MKDKCAGPKPCIRGSARLMCRCVVLLAGLGTLTCAGAIAQDKPALEGDLDRFMAQVLQRREINWETLQSYIFSEKEALTIRGMKVPALDSFERKYVWFVRDGYLVRSPVRMDGVKVSAEEQARAEEEWMRERKKRRKNVLGREEFFGFKFEPGRYLFAGRQSFEGRDLLAVEYYPRIRDKEESGKRDPEDEKYESMLEKTLRATMLILPEEHQIVRITFDNVGLEFLPGRWLVRLDDVQAFMVMDKPLGDVWLPREVAAFGSVTTAAGTLSVRYSREFYSYAKTDVKVKLWYDKPGDKAPPPKPR